MGIITCSVHGNQGFYEVCEHIWGDFEKGVFPEMKEISMLGTKICNNCYLRFENEIKQFDGLSFERVLDFNEKEQLNIENKVSLIYDSIKTKLKCTECVNQIRLIDAKRNGEEPSFEYYENTLMYKDIDIINRLKQVLIRNYQFQKSRIPFISSFDAFHIASGGVSYPLSIKIYYVTQEQDQKKLIRLINDFFEKIPQKQRKISFYESENWIIEKSKNGIHQYRGQEQLLLEQIVR